MSEIIDKIFRNAARAESEEAQARRALARAEAISQLDLLTVADDWEIGQSPALASLKLDDEVYLTLYGGPMPRFLVEFTPRSKAGDRKLAADSASSLAQALRIGGYGGE